MEFIKNIITQMQANFAGSTSKSTASDTITAVTKTIDVKNNIARVSTSIIENPDNDVNTEKELNFSNGSIKCPNEIVGNCLANNIITIHNENSINVLKLRNPSSSTNSNTKALNDNSIAYKDKKKSNEIAENKHDTPTDNNATNIFEQNNTLSCIKEFDDILEEYKRSGSNSVQTVTDVTRPILTLSETVELINNINSDGKSSVITKNCTLTLNHSEISSQISPCLSSELNNITNEQKITFNCNDHNYSLTSTSSNSTGNKLAVEFSVSDFYEKCPKNEHNKSPQLLNNIKGEEIEIYIDVTNKYHFDHEILVNIIEENSLENNDDLVEEKMSIISISSEDADDLDFPTLDTEQIYADTINDLDIISISSTEIDVEKDDDSECEGYHSSDFEFIEENEACSAGLVTKASISETKPKCNELQTVEIAEEKPGSSANFFIYFEQAGPSNIQSNRLMFRYDSNTEDIEKDFRNDHVMPEGNDFVELFEQPWSAYSFQAENKSFYSTKRMHVELDDVGFNVEMLQRRHDENKVDAEFEQEAKESAKKILSMYPGENRKRRRIH